MTFLNKLLGFGIGSLLLLSVGTKSFAETPAKDAAKEAAAATAKPPVGKFSYREARKKCVADNPALKDDKVGLHACIKAAHGK